MDRRDPVSEQVHCGRCDKQLNWDSSQHAFTKCSCPARPEPADQLKELAVTRLPQVPTVANMTLRDWFAGQALAGQLSIPTEHATADDFAKSSYQMADAMLKAREVKP
jgi:hypothetical protein